MSSDDTIFALSTGQPPAAIAIIRSSGPRAFAAAELLSGELAPPRTAALRPLRSPEDGRLLDEAIVVRFEGPHSATGEDVVEYQCHGGRAVVNAILSGLASIEGLRPALPGEFTRRALANGRIDLTEAEGLADLLEAETESQRRAALLMAGGGLSAQIRGWRERLVSLSARAEAAIDYVGDEDETAVDEAALASEASTLAGEMASLLGRARIEPLKSGIRVVVAGPPNAGKSSLVNALTRSDRAIVTDVPGTTRDVIEVPVSIAGVPFVLVDTAGLRDSDDPVEAIGIERAHAESLRADIVLWVGADNEVPDQPNVIALRTKSDLLPMTSDQRLAISAVSGEGLGVLVDKLVEKSSAILPFEGQLALNMRQEKELGIAAAALTDVSPDIVILADSLRRSLVALDRLTGQSSVEDMLDALFGRFCLGK